MRPITRTPQQRDRRFARARRLTQTVFVGAGAASAVLTGFVAANAKPVTTTPVTAPSTTTTVTQPSGENDDSASTVPTTAPATGSTVPTTAPVTSTTVCTTTPSGTVTCY
ncbi:MAG TPA: hypothetical protein VND83_04495 [Acidimicrobiales bacterium]|nr:hypothetical protein [Acidimicrobiales bacterium]